MKIAFVSASEVPSIRANSIQVMKVSQAFVQMRQEVRLYVPAHGVAPNVDNLADFYGLQQTFPVEWIPGNPRWKRYDFSWLAVRRAKDWGAQAVYVWPLQAAFAAQILGLPYWLELHEPPSGRLGPVIFRSLLGSGRKCFLPITRVLAEMLRTRYPRFDSRHVTMHIAPDGVDMERYIGLPAPTIARQSLGLPEVFTVGYTGHLYPGRGMALLAGLARRFPQVNFLWVGGRAEDVAFWRGRLNDNGLTNVSLTGFIANSRLPLYQAAAEILLMPYERVVTGSSGGNTANFSSPMKMFEYMACRRAIISSSLPSITEVLNSTNAVLCPPEDEEAWAVALESLMVNAEQRERLAAAALADARQYTWLERARESLRILEG